MGSSYHGICHRNVTGGAHFTSRDIIYVMSHLLAAGDESAFWGDGISKNIFENCTTSLRQAAVA